MSGSFSILLWILSFFSFASHSLHLANLYFFSSNQNSKIFPMTSFFLFLEKFASLSCSTFSSSSIPLIVFNYKWKELPLTWILRIHFLRTINFASFKKEDLIKTTQVCKKKCWICSMKDRSHFQSSFSRRIQIWPQNCSSTSGFRVILS